MTDQQIALEDVLALIPQRVSLYYVDYRDSFDESMEQLQQCIHSGEYDALDIDFGDDSRDYYIKELKSDLEREFDIDDASDILYQYEDKILNTLFDRDDSDVVGDLLRNTSDPVMFIETGYEVESESWSWSDARVRLERIMIKRKLGLICTGVDNQSLDDMIRQASYGGQLVVFFTYDAKAMIKQGNGNATFRNGYIAIINTYNGSGDHCQVSAEFTIPYNRERVFIDETIKYNYSFEVCGMDRRWCADADVTFSERAEPMPELEESSIARVIAQNAEYDRVYKSGSCSFGDMDIRRHRKSSYVNEYPCGNRCADCGTFWID